jgi:uncharacterized membrane protein YgdD (TMEM256/DUF423 family)
MKNFNPRKLFALLFGLFGGASVLLLAYSHHAVSHNGELIAIAANIMMPHALLGLFALSQFDKIGRYSCVAAMFILLGIFLFAIPVTMMGFGILTRTPSAPFGGISFTIAWVALGLGYFLRKSNDIT